jgi:hypothetical protein
MGADGITTREMWLAVARASAEHRRVADASAGVFYGDLTLRESADARAAGELTRAICRAAEAAVGEEEIVDALLSGDPRLEVSEAVELVAWARSRDERLRELNQKIVGDLLGED